MLIVTPRLRLTPVAWRDLADLVALKGDPRAFAVMLGGVRSQVQVQAELAADQAFWSRRGVGMWAVRGRNSDDFVGLTGIMDRPDGWGLSLRFAIRPELQGRGIAREAAGAALRDALDRAGLQRVVAVARRDNTASRTVLGGIGMRPCGAFLRAGCDMVVYEAVGPQSSGSMIPA